MDIDWLHRNNNELLILFCNGWGMDSRPFLPLPSLQYDVLVCSNYMDITVVPDIERLKRNYTGIILIGWSMGVAYGQQLYFEKSSCFTKKIAVNGTLCPVNDSYGIPPGIFESTLDNMNEKTLLRFYKRMCRSREVYSDFLENRPVRNITSQTQELKTILGSTVCLGEEKSIYTDVIISDKDYIIPTNNQQQFWQSSNAVTIPASHFPFYLWKSWDDLVESTRSYGESGD